MTPISDMDIRGSVKSVTAPKPHYAAKRDAYREAHIPGAVFVDWTEDIIDPTAPAHMMLAEPARFKALITYCNAGVSASVGLFALKLAGFDNVRNYPGFWYEWESDSANPIERDWSGPRPGRNRRNRASPIRGRRRPDKLAGDAGPLRGGETP